ncbi:MAG: YdcF family protein [Planctomycetota bacterium]|jgi:vancomycin permeability regulator SanA
MGRAIAGCLGLFALLSGSENLWWIDLRPIPWIAAVPLLAHAIRPARWTRVGLALLIGVCAWNAVAYYRAPLYDAPLVPFSLVAAGLLALCYARVRSAIPTMVVLALGFPLAQTWFFGKTDYRRPADAIVVLGAHVYADGRVSDSLADRVRTGVELYHQGLAPRMVMSGGPGDGEVHETEAMRDLAIELGVPRDAIELDLGGLNTRATVANTRYAHVLAVSHHWHLPRIKMAYRQAGKTAYTVPARESYVISQTPRLTAREIAAFWWYWACGLR